MKAAMACGFAIVAVITLVWFAFESKAMRQVPDLSFPTITGEVIDLKQWQGQPIVMTFWATDCPVCIKDIPHLVKLYKKYSPQGLKMVAVSMYYDMPSRVIAMTRDKALPYPVALDPMAKIAKAFGDVQQTPKTFLISADGKIVLSNLGAIDLLEYQSRLNQILGNAVNDLPHPTFRAKNRTKSPQEQVLIERRQ